MARYIDADKLKERIEYYYSHTGDQTTNAEHYAYGVALKEIDQLPTADVVEVVRCKDCKYRKKDKLFVSGHYCYLRPVNGGRFCEDDGFCSYGERKDGKDTNVPTK